MLEHHKGYVLQAINHGLWLPEIIAILLSMDPHRSISLSCPVSCPDQTYSTAHPPDVLLDDQDLARFAGNMIPGVLVTGESIYARTCTRQLNHWAQSSAFCRCQSLPYVWCKSSG